MDTLIGPLPSGWEEVALGDVCEIQAGPSGAGSASREFTTRGTPLVRPVNISSRRVRTTQLVHLNEESSARLDRYRLEAGDVVGVRTGTLGRFALVSPEQDGWLYSTQILRFRPSPELDPGYLVHYLTLPGVQRWIDRNASGSTIKSITQRTLRSLPIALPSLRLQKSIGASLSALDDKVRLHAEISQATSELHDALAPLLFSGEVVAAPPDA